MAIVECRYECGAAKLKDLNQVFFRHTTLTLGTKRPIIMSKEISPLSKWNNVVLIRMQRSEIEEYRSSLISSRNINAGHEAI